MYFNLRHKVRTLPILNKNTPVWVQTGKRQVPGTIISRTQMPRSYTVQTSSGEVHRNRCHLAPRLGEQLQTNNGVRVETEMAFPEGPASEGTSDTGEQRTVPRSPIQTCLRTGATMRPPSQFT